MTDHDRDFASYRFTKRQLSQDATHRRADDIVFWGCIVAGFIIVILDWMFG